ncbi:MAG: proprotein convertase P-domain-containing protein [Deltaproteobacteria bacterium]|nr:proprotein convertase P-domain-containing protein [Deltaproteobacteria bacterium]
MASCLRSLIAASATLAALIPASALAQGGPDSSGYLWSSAPYDFVVLDPAAGGLGTVESITGSSFEIDVALPWAGGFSFYGNSYTDITVSEEGGITMGAGGNMFGGNGSLPDTSSSSADIAVFWDELDAWDFGASSSNGGLFTYYDSAADRFIVSWENVSEGGDDATLSFQAHLYGNGEITFHYADVTSEDFISSSTGVDNNSFGNSATVGIQDFTGGTAASGNALQISYNTPSLVDGVTAYSIVQCVDVDGDGGYAESCGGDDCDDADPLIFAGQAEVCSDGVDQDCNGYDQVSDQDLDTFLNPACGGDDCDDLDPLLNPASDQDADGSLGCTDCDDNDATAVPGGLEICDGVDNDCDGTFAYGLTFGDNANSTFGPGGNRGRGSWWDITTDVTLTELGANMGVPAGEDLTFGIYEGVQGGSTFTQVWTGTITSTDGALADRMIPVGYPLTSGNRYFFGYVWSASSLYGYNTAGRSAMPTTPFGTMTDGATISGSSLPTNPTSTSSTYYSAIVSFSDAAAELLDSDADGISACLGDCDDSDATAVPGGTEFCGDGVDNDCSGVADDIDADLDGEIAALCGGTDCNDADATINTAAVELCDAIDSDCDGLVDANDTDVGTVLDAPVLLTDAPAAVIDGTTPIQTSSVTVAGTTNPVLDINVTVDVTHAWTGDVDMSLTSPTGTVIDLVTGIGGSSDNFTNTVFDDQASATIGSGSAPYTGSFIPETPLATFSGEAADGVWTLTVEDTFPSADDGVLNSWTLELTTGIASDIDGDGWVDAVYCAGADCDDTDAALNPGAAEICGDSLDQDCDGVDLIDDVDLDTFTSVACGGDDCDDTDPNVFNGSDFDLDLALGCQDDCDDNDATANPNGVEVCNDGIDQDCSGADLVGTIDNDLDGENTCTDCDDTNPAINAAATEVCGDGIDNNCSGTADDVDADGDGDFSLECGGGDCDEADATVFAGATEACDGIDGDCDGLEDGQDTDLLPAGSAVSGTNAPGSGISSTNPLTTDTITIASGTTDTIIDVNLTIDITHTWLDDLDIFLVSPDGVSVEIVTDIGSSGDDFTNTVFDDQAATPIPDSSSEAPFTGTYQPEGSLAAFNGGTVDGVWTLEITDDAGGDNGTLNSWTIDLQYGASPDADGDGWYAASFCSFGDCDDDPLVNVDAALTNPGAAEVCGDTIDQDCDGADLVADIDLDTYSSVACGGDDCDDADATVNVAATEVCNDTIDNDCDALTLDVDDVDGDGFDCIADCDDNDDLSYPGFYELCNDGADNDCNPATPDLNDADGDGDDCTVDCDDTNPLFGPSQTELLCSGFDEDCDFGVSTPDIDDGDLDGFNCDEECLDTDPAVNPAAVEVNCDGLDNDCDPATEGEVDVDGDGSTCGFDCDDNEPLAFPGNVEACNDSVDNDCDPTTVDDFDIDLDGVTCVTDCDDNDPLSFPGAPEICADGIDQDCDLSIDEVANDAYDLSDDDSVLIGLCGISFPFCGTNWDTVYVSSNGRITFGFDSGEHTESAAVLLSEAPQIAAFWNDLDPSAGGTVEVQETPNAVVVTYTDVPELGVAGSANTATVTLFDDGTASFVYGSLSMGDGLVGFSCGTSGDVVETDVSEYEFASNQWAVGQGTESAVYELFSGTNPNDLADSTVDFCLSGGDDADGDGWTDTCGDCDDAAADVFPGADDVCGDSVDQDCDGTADNADLDGDGEIDVACGGVDCDDLNEDINTGATEICNGIDDDCSGAPEDGGADDDGDGFLICGGDCDDTNDAINPDAAEVCDQVDNDCDGALDNGFTPDFDNDGQVSDDCGGDDCDDTNDAVFVGADEICDLADNDCNGEIDEIDVDEDTFIDGNCNGDDCNDNDAAVNPGAAEVPYDGIDNDCSGGDVVDADGDGFFGGESGTDCNDGDAAVNPDAEEICDDDIDNNCNGGTDQGDKDNDIDADAVCSDCNCSSSLIDDDAPTGSAMMLLGLVGLMGMRRRRQ